MKAYHVPGTIYHAFLPPSSVIFEESITIISVLQMGHRVVKGLTQSPTSELMAELG